MVEFHAPDIAGGVHLGKGDLDVGFGDQGIMVWDASAETEEVMPLTHAQEWRSLVVAARQTQVTIV